MKVVWMVVTKASLLVDVRVDVMVGWTAAKRAESSAAKMDALLALRWVDPMAALTAARSVESKDVQSVGKRAALWVGN